MGVLDGITVQNLVGVNRLTLTADFVIEAAATVGPQCGETEEICKQFVNCR